MTTNAYRDDHAAAIEMVEGQRCLIENLNEQIRNLQHADRAADRHRRRTHTAIVLLLTALSLSAALGIVVGVLRCAEVRQEPLTPAAIDYCAVRSCTSTEGGTSSDRACLYGVSKSGKRVAVFEVAQYAEDAIETAKLLGCPLEAFGQPQKGAPAP